MSDWMDLEELRSVQTRERATDGLQDLRDSFYEDVATYLASLRKTRQEVAAEAADPFRSPEVNDLTDEIETAEQVAEAIYERRIGKLLKEASLAASGMADDPDGLTTEERALYGTIVDLIEENKDTVLSRILGSNPPAENVLANSGSDDTASPSPSTETTRTQTPDETSTSETGSAGGDDSSSDPSPDGPDDGFSSTDAAATTAMSRPPSVAESEPAADGDSTRESNDGGAEAEGPETAAASDDEAAESVTRTKVRITEDVGEILGVDRRSYSLRRDDIVDLPEENAAPLVDREAAERLD